VKFISLEFVIVLLSLATLSNSIWIGIILWRMG